MLKTSSIIFSENITLAAISFVLIIQNDCQSPYQKQRYQKQRYCTKFFPLNRSQPSPITVKRIANIINHLTYEVFKYSCRGLYETDKFIFTLMLALKIDMQANAITHDQFMTFIKGIHLFCVTIFFRRNFTRETASTTPVKAAD